MSEAGADPNGRRPVDEGLRDRLGKVLAGERGITLALLFGSAARGQLGASSDIDIAVAGAAAHDPVGRTHLMAALALASGRPVDLVDLGSAGQPLLGRILAEGLLLKGERADLQPWLFRNVTDHEDFLPLWRRLLDERRRAWLTST